MKRFLPTMLTAFLLAPVSSVGADLGQIYNVIQVHDDGTVPAVSMQAPVPMQGTFSMQGTMVMPTSVPMQGVTPMHMPMIVEMPAQMPFMQQPVETQPVFDMETPYRCQGNGFYASKVSTTLPVDLNEFNLIKVTKSDALPRFEVNGYSFENRPLDEALQYLVDEADILVYTQDNAYPSLSAQHIYGDLETVVKALSENAGMYYIYDANSKRLSIARQAEFEVSLPNNRFLMFAVLDALRGAGI